MLCFIREVERAFQIGTGQHVPGLKGSCHRATVPTTERKRVEKYLEEEKRASHLHSAAKDLCVRRASPFAEFTLSEANGLRVTGMLSKGLPRSHFYQLSLRLHPGLDRARHPQHEHVSFPRRYIKSRGFMGREGGNSPAYARR